MLDVRKPLGLLFIILGALLFLYGMFVSQPVNFQTPNAFFPLKLNMPVGAFMFVFGVVMWQLARYVELKTLDTELTERERELDRVEKKRAKALAKQQAAAAAAAAAGIPGSIDLSDTNAARQSKMQGAPAIAGVDNDEDDYDAEDDDDVDTKNDTTETLDG